jgi:putative phage-type endonuclease
MTATATATVLQLDSREEWLAARRSGLGGSDAAVVMGVSHRKSAYTLWTEKAGLVPPDTSDNAVLRWGRKFESPIAEEYAEITGRKVVDLGAHAIQRHPERPWQICTHDRLIEPIDGRGRGVLSVKFIGPISARDWEQTWLAEQGPIDYKIQAQHEMLVSGLTWGSFAVYIWGHGVKWCDFDLNPNFAEALIDEEADFWRRVQEGDAPPVDGSESTKEALKRLYPRDSGRAVELPAEVREWIAEIKNLKGVEGNAEQRVRLLENQIKGLMGDASEGIVDGRTVCTLRTTQRKGYVVEPTSFRTLKLKGEK